MMPPVVDVPLTRTVSFGSSVVSFTGISSNVAVPSVSPATIVSTKSATAVKSPASAVPPATETVTVASASRAAASSVPVTVTIRAFPVAPSDTLDGDTVSVTCVDVDSSSVIVSVTASGDSMARSFCAEPVTVTSRSRWSMSLSRAAIVTTPMLVVDSAAMVSVVPLCVKSSASAPDAASGVVDTVTIVSSLEGWSSVAVTVLTVLEPPSSGIDTGSSTSDTCGVASLSTIVTCTPPTGNTVRPETDPVTTTVSFGSSIVSFTGASVNVAVPSVLPELMVSVTSLTCPKSTSSTAVPPRPRPSPPCPRVAPRRPASPSPSPSACSRWRLPPRSTATPSASARSWPPRHR